MKFYFTKMHGLGNDFVIIDCVSQSVDLTTEQIRGISDRSIGIGCDQLLMIELSNKTGMDFKYRIFNRDGSEVEQCGNGARCIAYFLRYKQLTEKENISVETKAGSLNLRILSENDILVDMGFPDFNPSSIPILTDKQRLFYNISVDDMVIKVYPVSLGNPHAVILVNNLESIDVQEIGARLSVHSFFPKGCNVGFAHVLDVDTIKLSVYERGVGVTKACGSGACAAMVIARKLGLVNSRVRVLLTGGELYVEWSGDISSVSMQGSATWVFDGCISI